MMMMGMLLTLMTMMMVTTHGHASNRTEETTQPVGSILLRRHVAHGLMDLGLMQSLG